MESDGARGSGFQAHTVALVNSKLLSSGTPFTSDKLKVELCESREVPVRPRENQKGLPMPLLNRNLDREAMRRVIRSARRITGMLQGTMGLEGQGLDKQTLRKMKRLTIEDLLRVAQ